jgi:hypothetical protein
MPTEEFLDKRQQTFTDDVVEKWLSKLTKEYYTKRYKLEETELFDRINARTEFIYELSKLDFKLVSEEWVPDYSQRFLRDDKVNECLVWTFKEIVRPYRRFTFSWNPHFDEEKENGR